MSEPFGFLEGAKSLGNTLDSARGVSKELSTSIANVQKEATDLAQQRAQERQARQQQPARLFDRRVEQTRSRLARSL